MMGEESTQSDVLVGYDACGVLHFQGRMDPALLELLQTLLDVVDKFPPAGARFSLVISKTDLDRRGFILTEAQSLAGGQVKMKGIRQGNSRQRELLEQFARG